MSRLSYIKKTTTSAAPFLCDVGWLLNFVDSQWSYGRQMPRRRSLIVSIFFFPQVTASGPIKNISWILLYLCDLHFGFDCLIYDFFSVSFQGIFGFRWTSTHRRFSIFSGPRLTGDLRVFAKPRPDIAGCTATGKSNFPLLAACSLLRHHFLRMDRF
jgi:hypothetical protein